MAGVFVKVRFNALFLYFFSLWFRNPRFCGDLLESALVSASWRILSPLPYKQTQLPHKRHDILRWLPKADMPSSEGDDGK